MEDGGAIHVEVLGRADISIVVRDFLGRLRIALAPGAGNGDQEMFPAGAIRSKMKSVQPAAARRPVQQCRDSGVAVQRHQGPVLGVDHLGQRVGIEQQRPLCRAGFEHPVGDGETEGKRAAAQSDIETGARFAQAQALVEHTGGRRNLVVARLRGEDKQVNALRVAILLLQELPGRAKSQIRRGLARFGDPPFLDARHLRDRIDRFLAKTLVQVRIRQAGFGNAVGHCFDKCHKQSSKHFH